MPHYKDGTPAQVGDHVRGRGYNIKEEIFGVVVGVVPDSDSCNIQVAYLRLAHYKTGQTCSVFAVRDNVVQGCGPEGGADDNRAAAYAAIEYGACKDFEKIV